MLRTWGPLAALLLASAPARAEPLPLRVISWNVWGVPGVSDDRAARMEKIGPAITALRPDLVALQEVWADEDAAVLGDALRSGGLTFQEELSSSRVAAVGNAGLLIASRYPLGSVAFRPFAQGALPHTPWHLDWMSTKGILEVTVETPLGRLRFADTHLQAKYETSDYLSVRLGQAIEIADLLRAKGPSGPRDPLVLAGDFNTGPTELPFRALLAGADLTPTTLDFRIDTVVYRPGDAVSVRALAIENVLEGPVALGDGRLVTLSDHAAILVDLELSPAEVAPSAASPEAALVVLTEARDVLRGDRSFARGEVFWARAGGFLLAGVSLFAMRRSKRVSAGWRRRAARAGEAALFFVGMWLLYLGFAQAPSQIVGLRRAATLLVKPPSDAPSP